MSIVSFVVHAQGERYLHHNFVVAVLNDLFGIQARGGCSCAGPYGHYLLGIDLERSHEFEREIGRGCEGIKPGWVRVNFNYFISDVVADYVIEAVRLVARDGWRLLGDYVFEPATGLWKHHDGPVEPPLRLHQVSFDHGHLTYPAQHERLGEDALAGHLADARAVLRRRDARAVRRGPRQRRLRPPQVVRAARPQPLPLSREPRMRGWLRGWRARVGRPSGRLLSRAHAQPLTPPSLAPRMK